MIHYVYFHQIYLTFMRIIYYCVIGRFYQGRRCSDDVRQIGRGNGVIGPGGRWRRNLANKVLASGLPLDQGCAKVTISPKIRQLLQVHRPLRLLSLI